MNGICHDCGEPREVHRCLVIKRVLALLLSVSDPCEQIYLCAVCAINRGITDWGRQ